MTTSKQVLLAKLQKLPSMPVVLQEIMASFKNENIDANTLGNMIAQDQGVSAKVLRVSNSPFYGLPRSVTSIQDAIVVLGFNSIRSLVISAGIVSAFPVVLGSSFNRDEYWKRSFRIAEYTKALSQIFKLESQLAFTAAMFHEIGLLVLDVCIPDDLEKVLQQQDFSENGLMAIEQIQLGFDHHEIGGELARLWNFPPEIERVIRYWNIPEHQPYDALSSMVYVAVLLESGLRGQDLIERLPEILKINTGIKWEDIEASMPKAEDLEVAAALLSV